MALFVLDGKPMKVLDPSLGQGALLEAIRRNSNRKIKTTGVEIDSGVIRFTPDKLIINDFLTTEFTSFFDGIICNPPYVRHHLILPGQKNTYINMANGITNLEIDRRIGLHVYFLIYALGLLKDGGRLAFIIPSDVFEGKFSPLLWKWITDHFKIHGIVSFDHDVLPFDRDINPVIALLEKTDDIPSEYPFMVIKSLSAGVDVYNELLSGTNIEMRNTKNYLRGGLTRPYLSNHQYVLGDFASVKRGVVTGNNDFFLMSYAESLDRNIPMEYLQYIIANTKDAPGIVLGHDDVYFDDAPYLKKNLMLNLDGRSISEYPDGVRDYILDGEKRGIHLGSVLSKRNPWYKAERRIPPTFLFTYLGSRRKRFVLNLTHAVPLTTFLCVYPLNLDHHHVQRLHLALNHEDVTRNLTLVGKTYGNGSIKVEPRALEMLPIPDHIVAMYQLV